MIPFTDERTVAVAIAKVVLIDMASRDVAYRALVLRGLGLLLLT